MLNENSPIFLEADLSQVEGRIVYMLTGDPKLVQEAQTKPWEHDMHQANAQLIFGKTEITEDERYIGKKGVHGAQRGMEGFRLAEIILNDTGGKLIRTPEECQQIIDSYHNAKPAVRDRYFRMIHQMLWDTRMLRNSWGREIHFPFDRWDKEVYKEAYSWIPQSENADLMNQWGVIPVWHWLRENQMRTQLLTQVHDSMLFTTYLNEIHQVADLCRMSLERPRSYESGVLSVPVTFKVGLNWKLPVEWKRLPEEKEVKEQVWNELLKGDPSC